MHMFASKSLAAPMRDGKFCWIIRCNVVLLSVSALSKVVLLIDSMTTYSYAWVPMQLIIGYT